MNLVKAIISICKNLSPDYPGLMLILILGHFILSCSSSKPKEIALKQSPGETMKKSEFEAEAKAPFAKLVFDSSQYHFGQLRKGEFLYKEIYFRNIDLQIDLISACECTTLDWSRLPIPPGGRSTLKIKYDSKDKQGIQIVDIDVMANTNPPNTYTKFTLEVIP
jgi:hypothetical protein